MKEHGSVWMPIPDEGYVAIGGVATKGWGKPDIQSYRCIREDLVENGKIGKEIWNDKDSRAKVDGSFWMLCNSQNSGINCFIPQEGYDVPTETVYVPVE